MVQLVDRGGQAGAAERLPGLTLEACMTDTVIRPRPPSAA
jgi:hypothetical protein